MKVVLSQNRKVLHGLGAVAGCWLSWGGMAGPVPEPGWVMRVVVDGMLPGLRPPVVIRVRAGGESIDVPGRWYGLGGEVGIAAEVPAETRWTGDVPTPGRLPLAREPVVWTWVMAVDGVELPPPTGAGSVLFGPLDRGRTDALRANFAVRAAGDTYSTWSRRIFGRETEPEGDPDGDGRPNSAEYVGGSNPLDPMSVPADGQASALRAVLDGPNLVLRWPASAIAAGVEESAELGGAWQLLPMNPQVEGPDRVIRIRALKESRFYRLVWP